MERETELEGLGEGGEGEGDSEIRDRGRSNGGRGRWRIYIQREGGFIIRYRLLRLQHHIGWVSIADCNNCIERNAHAL